MPIGAAYIRVSTEEQLEYSPDAQLREIKKFAEKNGILLAAEYIFIDEGISGRSTKKRDQFNQMIGLAKSKPPPFEVILLWRFSRFARNQEEAMVYKNMLRKNGVQVISVSEPIMEGPFGSLIERIIEWMDEYYSINLSSEVTRGMTEKAIRGEFQSAPPLGYTKSPGQPLQIVEQEARFIRYAFEEYLKGKSCFAIAKELNEMGLTTKRGNRIESRTVDYILNNPVYSGYIRWTPTGKTVGNRIYDSQDTLVVKSDHQPIISQKLFRQVQLKQSEKSRYRSGRRRPAETRKHYLSGLLKCGGCGSSLSYIQSSQGFQCTGYSKGLCKTSHYIRATKIEKLLVAALHELGIPETFTSDVFSERRQGALIQILEKINFNRTEGVVEVYFLDFANKKI